MISPGFQKFLRRRLDGSRFSGLPVTLLSLGALICLFLFLSWLQDYLFNDPLVAVDTRFVNLLYAMRSPHGLAVFYGITLFAEATTVGIAIVVASIFLWLSKLRRSALALFGGLVVVDSLVMILKQLIARERPHPFLQAISEDSFSFPSGHAAAAAWLFGLLAYLIIRAGNHKKKTRVFIVLAAVILIFAIDMSRLYLGVHFVSDVLAGNAIGLFVLFLTIGVQEGWALPSMRTEHRTTLRHAVVLAVIVDLCVAPLTFSLAAPSWNVPESEELTIIAASDVATLFEDGRLPKYSESLDGNAHEPISLVLIVPDSCLRVDFLAADWTLADPISVSSLARVTKATILNEAYDTAPMIPLFYNTWPHTAGFEKETNAESIRSRHHARFWKTSYTTPLGRVYVGTASLDTGIKWGITHTIAPDIDSEREALLADLQAGGMIVSQEFHTRFTPRDLGQNITGDLFFTDGDAVFVTLAACP